MNYWVGLSMVALPAKLQVGVSDVFLYLCVLMQLTAFLNCYTEISGNNLNVY